MVPLHLRRRRSPVRCRGWRRWSRTTRPAGWAGRPGRSRSRARSRSRCGGAGASPPLRRTVRNPELAGVCTHPRVGVDDAALPGPDPVLDQAGTAADPPEGDPPAELRDQALLGVVELEELLGVLDLGGR